MSTEEFLQAAKILLAHVAASAPVALQDERGKDNPSDNDGPISGLVLNTAPSIPANHGHIPLPPSYDEKYSETCKVLNLRPQALNFRFLLLVNML